MRCVPFLTAVLLVPLSIPNAIDAAPHTAAPIKLARHLTAIAALAQPSPPVDIPAGEFSLGSNRIDDDPYGLSTQFDDTELPQQRIWIDGFALDRDEVSLGEFLAFLQQQKRRPAEELQKLIWHVITVHSVSDQTLSRWPALYMTWQEASDFCASRGKRLPTEAEWEKSARGPDGNLFPWGQSPPDSTRAMFGQHHVHEIPILAAVDSLDKGNSPYGIHHMAGNVAEWLATDYKPYPNSPAKPDDGNKIVRGGAFNNPAAEQTATDRFFYRPSQKFDFIGFRCAKNAN